MYEDIRKPGLLKNIPLLFIRALPSLYYYSKFSAKFNHSRCRDLFQQNLEYLACAISLLNEQVKADHLLEILKVLHQMQYKIQDASLSKVENISIELSNYCNLNVIECRNFYREHKQKLIDLYHERVMPLNILITDIQTDQKLAHLLSDFCYYKVQHSSINNHDFNDKLNVCDFVILTNIDTTDIHRQIEQINTFKKPAMVVTGIDKSDIVNKSGVRHAMQLIRRGFPVIFKIITPIRLFTSVEKTFFKYHAQIEPV